MGQKVNPNGFRIGVNKDWNATWVAPKKDIATFIKEDHDVRTFIMKNYGTGSNNCSISKITIDRTPTRVMVNIFTGRPGMLIGQKGAGIDKLKKDVEKILNGKTLELNVREVKNLDSDATLVAQSIASQLERRIAWRRAMKMAIQKAMRSGTKGIKVMVGGRLDGADIARSEHYQQGILPLHTLRSDIDYGFAEAKTTFGIIGVKCWICYGEIKGKSRRSGEVTRASRSEGTSDRRPPRAEGDRRPSRPFSGGFRPQGDRPQSHGAQGSGNGAPRPPFDPNRPRPSFNQPKVGNNASHGPRPSNASPAHTAQHGAPSAKPANAPTHTTHTSSAPRTGEGHRVFTPKPAGAPTHPTQGGKA